MTTPEGPGTPAEQPDDRPTWGAPPAGGWGGDSTRSGWDQGGRRGQGGGWADPGAETRAWSGPPAVDDGPTRVDHPRAAPTWAQQPPPGGGWNAGAPPAPGSWDRPPPPGGPDPYGRPAPAWPGSAPPGYPPLPRPGDGPARRSRLPLVIAAIVVALLLAVGAVLAFVTPGFLRTTVFDRTALQDGVQRVLLADYRYGEVSGVACGAPGEQITVRAEATFTCTATVDGAPVTVPVRIVSADGTYEVGRPV